VLLVGGSSRIPIVAEMVTEALGRPVAVDTHPKHSVALGAARTGAGALPEATVATPPPGAVPVAPPPGAVPVAGVPVVGSPMAAAPGPDPEHTELMEATTGAGDAEWAGVPADRTGVLPPDVVAGAHEAVGDDPTEPALAAIGPADDGRASGRRRGRLTAAGLVVLLVLGGLAVVNLARGGGEDPEFALDPIDDPDEEVAEGAIADEELQDEPEPISEEEPDPVVDPVDEGAENGSEPEPQEPEERALPPVACDGGLCIEIDDIVLDGGELLITWTADGFVPDTAATHAHFYWGVYEAEQVGTNATDRAPWELTDDQPFVPGGELQLANRPAGADSVCVTAADSAHAVIEPANHHCVPLPADA
jgi:hypothetical protein